MQNFSLVQFEIANYHSVLLSSRPFFPITTLLLKLVSALIESEPEPDEKMKERIKWIYENTHEKVREHVSIIELVTFRNIDRGLNREVEIGHKNFSLTDLYKYLDEISIELTKYVIIIGRKYNIDIPYNSFNKSQSISLT